MLSTFDRKIAGRFTASPPPPPAPAATRSSAFSHKPLGSLTPHPPPPLPCPPAEYATALFRKQGIELVTNSRVVGVTADGVTLFRKETQTQEALPADTVVWATGVGLHPLARSLAAALPAGTQKNTCVREGNAAGVCAYVCVRGG